MQSVLFFEASDVPHTCSRPLPRAMQKSFSSSPVPPPSSEVEGAQARQAVGRGEGSNDLSSDILRPPPVSLHLARRQTSKNTRKGSQARQKSGDSKGARFKSTGSTTSVSSNTSKVLGSGSNRSKMLKKQSAKGKKPLRRCPCSAPPCSGTRCPLRVACPDMFVVGPSGCHDSMISTACVCVITKEV